MGIGSGTQSIVYSKSGGQRSSIGYIVRRLANSDVRIGENWLRISFKWALECVSGLVKESDCGLTLLRIRAAGFPIDPEVLILPLRAMLVSPRAPLSWPQDALGLKIKLS